MRADIAARCITGGEAVVNSLISLGIKTLFGLPGVQNDWLYNALYDRRQDIKVLHTRHEQGAAYMALGQALATGDPSVFNVVPGPGLLNAGAALSTAYALNAKVLCLSGQIPSKAIGRDIGHLHEINRQLDIIQSLTKWAARINSPAEAPALVGEAFRQMHSGRPRPVGLEVPMDILQARAVVDLAPVIGEPFRPPLDEDAIEDAARLLGGARTPMIFVGSGAQDVSEHVRELAQALQAPVVGYRTGMGVMDGRSPLALHLPAAKDLWSKADAVLAIGTNMRVPMGKWARAHSVPVIRIDVDPTSHLKFAAPQIAMTAFAQDALPVLRNRLERHNHVRASRTSELEAVRANWRARASVLEPQLGFLRVIREELGEDGIFVDELTQVGFASRITYPVYKPRTFISTGYQGTLGYGFPTALGVKFARPDAPVISVTGDGGFMFAVQELATGVQHKIPLIVLVFNNNQYGNVQQMQKNDYGGRVIASDLHNPDFVRMAETFGAQGIRAETLQQVRQAIRRGLEVDVPTIVEIPVGDMPSADQFR
jgi:acetolactate synthase-1/2/3 large subunit